MSAIITLTLSLTPRQADLVHGAICLSRDTLEDYAERYDTQQLVNAAQEAVRLERAIREQLEAQGFTPGESE